MNQSALAANPWTQYDAAKFPAPTSCMTAITSQVLRPGYHDKSMRTMLGGNSYFDIYLNGNGKDNGIGLRFLARHLVTFDFPKQTMYLKRTSIGPLIDEDTAAAVKFLKNLKNNGQQPGWSKDEKGQIDVDAYPITKTLGVQKQGDSTIYLYTIARPSKDGLLTLQRAWRMDQDCRTVEEFPISSK